MVSTTLRVLRKGQEMNEQTASDKLAEIKHILEGIEQKYFTSVEVKINNIVGSKYIQTSHRHERNDELIRDGFDEDKDK